MKQIQFKIKDNAQDFVKYFDNVPYKTQHEIESKIPTLRRNTKKKVQSQLTSNFGVNEGVYRRSFIINNFAESKWHVGFQVFAKAPHYRLTHLLEGWDESANGKSNVGHKTILFRWGKGRPTHIKGVKGMSHVKQTKNHYKGHQHIAGWTGRVRHIAIGQEYAEGKIVSMYKKAIENNLERINWK